MKIIELLLLYKLKLFLFINISYLLNIFFPVYRRIGFYVTPLNSLPIDPYPHFAKLT